MQLLRKIRNKPEKENNSRQNSKKPLVPGTAVPEFSLPASNDQIIEREDLIGRPTILAFYPADNSPVCSNQMALYNEALHLFQAHGAQLFGISIDSLDSHKSFAGNLNLNFPLLADNDPAGAVAKAFGVFDEKEANAKRALFVIGREGTIRWQHVSPNNVNPGANGILEALEEIAPIKGSQKQIAI